MTTKHVFEVSNSFCWIRGVFVDETDKTYQVGVGGRKTRVLKSDRVYLVTGDPDEAKRRFDRAMAKHGDTVKAAYRALREAETNRAREAIAAMMGDVPS